MLCAMWMWAEQEGAGGILQMLGGPILPFVMIGVLFWLLIFRPESRKRADLKKMLEDIKKNDRVVTIGGIHGTVVNVHKDSDDITLRIDESNNTRIRVLRSAIARIVSGDGASESGKTTE